MRISILDKVVSETMAAIEKSRNQIYDIAENARSEKERVQKELEEIQREVMVTIEKVDGLEHIEKMARLRLMEVSKYFNKYSEEEVHQAYDKARELQVKLASLRERENQLKLRRNDLERSLNKMQNTVEKAESLITQVGVIFDYLGGNLRNINDQLEIAMQRRQLAPKIIQAQEEERRRIAREIHDGPAQSMANVVLRTEVCEKLIEIDQGAVQKELLELREMVKRSLQDVRRIIFDLRPMALDDLGLIPAISRYLETLKERFDLDIEMYYSGTQQRLDSTIEVAIYRVIQEALQNILKHAQASHAKVSLENQNERLVVEVTDNGKGFNAEECLNNPKPDSYGLLGMKERLEILGGQLYITSKQGEGTKILAIMPLEM
jgi:two-component system sensor histidine kinase DegS